MLPGYGKLFRKQDGEGLLAISVTWPGQRIRISVTPTAIQALEIFHIPKKSRPCFLKKKCISRASRYASQPWCSWLGGSTSRWVQRWGAVKIFWYTMVPWAEKKSLGTTDLRFETINIPLSIGYHSRRIHSLPENANSTLNIANSAISSNLSYQRRPLKWPTAENLSQARCDTQDRLLGFPKRNKIRGFSSGDWAHNCNIRNISLVAHSQTPSC